MKKATSFFLNLIKIKSLSIYQFTLILIITTAILSVTIITAGWIIAENIEVKNKISVLKENALENQKEKLKKEVLQLISYIEFSKKNAVNNTPEQLKNNVLKYFESIRFGNDGYVFVNTYDGIALLFNGKKLETPESMTHINDPSGINLFETELNLAKLPNGGAFQYKFMKLNDSTAYPKMSYIMGFDQWGWILGAGDYLDNLDSEIIALEKELKTNLYNQVSLIISILIPILFILIILSIFPAKFIQKQFDKFVRIIKNPNLANKNELYLNKIRIRDLELIGKEILQSDELVKQFGHIIDEAKNEIYIFQKNDLQFVHANKGAIQNCGYLISELQNMTFLDILVNTNNDQYLNLVAPLKDKPNEKIQFESIYQRKNHTTYPIDVQLTLSNFNKEEVYVAFIYDITDRKKTEQELINSKNYVQTIFNSSTDAIFIHDAETGVILDVNMQMCTMFGYEKSEVVGKTAQHFSSNTAPYTEKEAMQWLLKSKTEGKQTFEWLCKHKDGTLFWGEVSIAYIKIDDEYRFLATTRNADDRKKASLELKESEAYSKALFEYAAVPIWVEDFSKVKACFNELSEQGVNDFEMYFNNNEDEVKRIASLVEIIEINQKNLELYEVDSKEELLGNLSDWFNEDSWLVFKDELIALAEGENSFESEITIVTPKKELKSFIISINVHPDYIDTLKIVFVSFLNITDRKKAEQELTKYREHLEEIIQERTEALSNSQEALLNLVDDLNIQSKKLETSNKQLAEINEELETFTYSVSHDLKAPLRGIDGYSQLLLEYYGTELNEEAIRFLNNIREGTNQMNVLIEDLLSYSRMERRDFLFDEILLRPLVEQIVNPFSKIMENYNIDLKCTISDSIKLKTDKEGITLVLRNVIDNAIKFSRNAEKPKIEIGIIDKTTKWLIFVKDNGIGFEMKYHDKIYKIFQRLHLPEEYEGTGIGLAMVYKAMNRMSGKVWAESEIKKGTTFYLEFNK